MGAEPEEFNLLESGMIQKPLYDLGADSLFLIGLVNDDVPDRRTIDKIRQNTPKSDQLIPVPCTERHVGMTQHVLRILKRPILGPGRLMEEPKKLGCLGFSLFGKGHCGLEGWRHLVLDYLPVIESMTSGVYEENDVNASA